MLIFRQLFDPQSSTYSYLLADRRSLEAILIDPVFEQAGRDAALVHELNLKLVATLDTHVHADHVTGAWLLKTRFESAIAIAAASGAQGADRYLAHGDHVPFGSRHLEARATPGHTQGSISLWIPAENKLIAGDTLFRDSIGRTDLPGGDGRQILRSIHDKLLPLPDETIVIPGHGESTTIGREKQFNYFLQRLSRS